MGINFPDGSQYYPTSTIQCKQQLFSSIQSYSTSSSSFQDVMTCTLTARSNVSKLLVYIEVHGYNSGESVDRSFGADYKVGSGSYISFGDNPNTYSGMQPTFQHNNRGNDHIFGYFSTMQFLIDNNWSDGDVLTVKLKTIGEGTFYLNQGSQTASGRFGRGRTHIILREEIGEPS